jgi:hypothetical protein
MNNDLTIICNGDSWVFGSEILDPELKKNLPPNAHVTSKDFYPENDSYRCSRIFSTYLAEIADARTVNISWPADDNTTILRRTIDYLTSEYIAKGKDTKYVLVIVGWSSPERNSFWYDDGSFSMLFRLWPNVRHFDTKHQEEFWKLYVNYIWNAQEYMSRYVYTILQFQNFCQSHNINWLCFNSFQQIKQQNINNWVDLNVKEELIKLSNKVGGYSYHTSDNIFQRQNKTNNLMSIWNTIDNLRFYKKDQEHNTFKSYIEKHNKGTVFNGWHPSPESHKLWALELWRYINEHKLI